MKKEGNEINPETLKTPNLMSRLQSRIEDPSKPRLNANDDSWNRWPDD